MQSLRSCGDGEAMLFSVMHSLRSCGGGEAMLFSVMHSLEETYRMLYMFNMLLLFAVYSSVLENLVLQRVHRILQSFTVYCYTSFHKMKGFSWISACA
jgi:hypothetical protein